jgi:hypothetical protein
MTDVESCDFGVHKLVLRRSPFESVSVSRQEHPIPAVVDLDEEVHQYLAMLCDVGEVLDDLVALGGKLILISYRGKSLTGTHTRCFVAPRPPVSLVRSLMTVVPRL